MFTLELSAVGRDVQIVTAAGPVALQESRELERGVIAGIGQGRTRVVLDLTDVTEVGTGLLGALLRVRRGVTRLGGTVTLVVDGPPVADMVETTLLGSLMQVVGDRAHAMMLVGAGLVEPAGDRRPARTQG